MLADLIEFAGVGVCNSGGVAGKLNDRNLHAEADTEVGKTVLACILRRQNHAFDASAAEAAGHQDAVYLLHCISERVLRQVF